MENEHPIEALFKSWPSRQALADDIGANVEAVHKWASAKSIPSRWQKRVVDAAAARGVGFATADWMLSIHDVSRQSVQQ